MNDFKLEYRSLLEEEKLLLFGKHIVKTYPFPVLKSLNTENYYKLFERLYAGEPITIPEFSDIETPIRVYIFHENAAGSKALAKFSEKINVPETTAYAKYKVNELLTPSIVHTVSLFNTTCNFTDPVQVYHNVNIRYTELIDTIQSGMFLSLYKGRVISAVSYKSLADTCSKFNVYQVRAGQPLTNEEARKLYHTLMFNLPTVLVDKVITEKLIIPNEILTNTLDYLSSFKTFVDALALPFESEAFMYNSITIAHDFINMNGFAYMNKSSYVLFGVSQKSPLSDNKSSDFTNALDDMLYHNTLSKDKSTSTIFNFYNNRTERGWGASANGSFIFLNEDNLETSRTLLAAGTQEYVELDKDFIDALKQIYVDRKDSLISNTLRERFKKEEFAIKRESFLSGLCSMNKRYIPLKNKDKKLLVLTKTSLAKEAARKMAITRKISIAMEPIIDMAIRILAMRDFDIGILNKRDAFPCNASRAFGFEYATTGTVLEGLHPEYRTWFDLRKEEFKKIASTGINTTTKRVITDLYDDVVYSGSPFWMLFNTVQKPYYRNGFADTSTDQKEKLILSYMISLFSSLFDDQTFTHAIKGYFSPASGLLDFNALANTLYYNSCYCKFKPELKYLERTNHSNHITGKQLHYLYVNNLLGVDQEQVDDVDRGKNSEYSSAGAVFVPANSGFTFSQDALDTFITLKKCKNFTDYYAWFKKLRPTLDSILSTTITDDYFTLETVKLFFDQSEEIFESLTKLEEKYIPKEEVKKRGRKAKVAIVATTTEPLEGEEDGGSTSVQSAAGTASTGNFDE